MDKFQPYTQPRVVRRSMARTWYVEYYDASGKRHQIYGGFGMVGQGNRIHVKPERVAWFNELCRRVTESLERPPTPADTPPAIIDISLSDALRLFERVKAGHLQTEGMSNVRTIVTAFIASVGDLLLSQVTTQTVAQFIASLPHTNTTRNNYRRELHNLFECMKREGRATTNPVTAVKRYKASFTKNAAYTADELRALFAATAISYPRLHLCMSLMFYAFMRPNKEIRILQGRHFDFERGTVTAPHTKSGKPRTVPITPELRTILIQYNAHLLQPDEWLFPSDEPKHQGKPLNKDYFKSAFKYVRQYLPDVAQPNQTLYSVRHTAACMLYDATKDPEKVRLAMGHATLTTTLVYLRSLDRFVGGISENDLPSLYF